MVLPPINLAAWISENKALLQPPVSNKVIWESNELIVMIVGGPNARDDYHVQAGEEFFYQLHGDMVLGIIDDTGTPQSIPIHAGEIFLLPPRTPHQPRRPANSVGLVVETQRLPHALDGFQWYCDNCHALLYEAFVPVKNIVTDLPPVFDAFYQTTEHTTCRQCGTVKQRKEI